MKREITFRVEIPVSVDLWFGEFMFILAVVGGVIVMKNIIG
jgi:hypothetical protein